MFCNFTLAIMRHLIKVLILYCDQESVTSITINRNCAQVITVNILIVKKIKLINLQLYASLF